MRDGRASFRGRILGACVAGAAALLIAAGPASAADRFAEVGGDGPSATCPELDPCSIVNAINNSASGDDVTLLGGSAATYAVGATPLVIPAGVTVHGGVANRPTITGNPGGGAGIQLGVGSVLRDAIYRYSGINNPAVRLSGGGTLDRVSSITLPAAGSNTGACRMDSSGTFVLRDTLCVHDTPGNGNGSGVRMVALSGETQDVTLTNVTAISTDVRPAISATRFSGSITVNAVNTIAHGVGGTDVEASSIVGSTNTPVTINLSHSNFADVAEGPAFNLNVTDAGTGPPNNNQTASPVFADPASYDYRQSRLSFATIDQGTATANTLDFEGTTRPQGGGYDIGADEIVRSDPPVISAFPASVEGDTTVSGTSTEPDGTQIELFLNASSIGFATVSGGNWTVTGLNLTPGTLLATAAAPGEDDSLPSAPKTVFDRTSRPVVAAPLQAGATTVSGTSTEADGAGVQVLVDGLPAGTLAPVAAGAWSATVPALAAGQVVTAIQSAPGKADSFASDPVTVLAPPAPPGGGAPGGATTTPPVTTTPPPKKCKKGRKLKKGKCMRKKRKKQ